MDERAMGVARDFQKPPPAGALRILADWGSMRSGSAIRLALVVLAGMLSLQASGPSPLPLDQALAMQ
jgi:hypothetical protein